MTDSKPASDLQPPPSNTNAPAIDPIKTSAEMLGHAQSAVETVAEANAHTAANPESGAGPDAKASSQTMPHQSTGDDVKEPHEHDESGSSQPNQTPANNAKIEQAKNDVDRGLVDTDRRPPMDPLYEKQKEGSEDGAKGEPRR